MPGLVLTLGISLTREGRLYSWNQGTSCWVFVVTVDNCANRYPAYHWSLWLESLVSLLLTGGKPVSFAIFSSRGHWKLPWTPRNHRDQAFIRRGCWSSLPCLPDHLLWSFRSGPGLFPEPSSLIPHTYTYFPSLIKNIFIFNYLYECELLHMSTMFVEGIRSTWN